MGHTKTCGRPGYFLWNIVCQPLVLGGSEKEGKAEGSWFNSWGDYSCIKPNF